MTLRRVRSSDSARTSLAERLNPLMDRRQFLRAAGIGAGVGVAGSLLPSPIFREASATPKPPELTQIKAICNNCAVGCGFVGEVQNGVWVSQEPWFDHPVNLGSLCSKGAAARSKVISEKRLRYPMKLAGGKWQRISWDQAMSEITAKLTELRKKYGPDTLMINGSAHHNNEMAYALRKFGAFWGSNNIDHQARICHSTTVAGLANMFGVGAMTNSMPDIRNSRSVFICGSNAAEAHPISMQHILTAKEVNRAPIIVADPRFTKTAAFANIYVRHRSGTDIALLMGLINIILANGWEDRKMLNERTYGFEELAAVAREYSPEVVEDITGVSKQDLHRIAKTLADNRPGCIIWAMGQTQHNNGTAVVRTSCCLQLVLGNMGKLGGGANVFRGHDNVQGATDLGMDNTTLPGYYGLAEGAWKHWANVWGVSYDYLAPRFKDKKMMEKGGFTLARWYEGAIQPVSELGQDVPIKAVIYWGCSSNCESQMDRVKKGLEAVELLVDIDPFVANTAVLPDRKDGVYILPAGSIYETTGSATNSNRQLQWRPQIVKPVWEAREDTDILLDFAERLGFKKEFAKNSKYGAWKQETLAEDLLREINLGVRGIGYIGQTPERLKRQQEWAHAFEVNTQRAEGGPVSGEYWGLPWPCWDDKHSGTPILYNLDRSIEDGGLPFRLRWGPKAPDEKSLFAAVDITGSKAPNASYGPPKDYATDLSGDPIKEARGKGMAPWGNGRARIKAWNIPDPIPIHREPIHSPRPDLIAKYPTYDDKKDHHRVTTLYKSLQKPDWVKNYPIILTTGRQVEFEGGGASERASWWLVELNDMYCEIHPKLANDYGIKNGDWMIVESPEDQDDKPSWVKVKAKVTRRVGPDTVFLPFHWGGMFHGQSLAHKFPEGTVPYGIGESANSITNYGYDIVTQMQETKTGLCRIKKA
jgi:formate dehydrogenase major subunit